MKGPRKSASKPRRPAENLERVEVTSRKQWRAWLEENHLQPESVWLVTYKKHCAERHVAYDDVVEEALCFGWIDSLPRKLDEDRTMLLLAPRKAKSPWSRLNKRRVAHLTRAGEMKDPGLAKVAEAKSDGSWSIYDEIDEMVVPEDLAQALAGNPQAKRHFDAFPPSAIKGILWWIKSARRAETRRRRIDETVRLAAKNQRANQSK